MSDKSMRWMTDYSLFVYFTTPHQLTRKGRIRCQDDWKWSEGRWPAYSVVLCQMGLTKCRTGQGPASGPQARHDCYQLNCNVRKKQTPVSFWLNKRFLKMSSCCLSQKVLGHCVHSETMEGKVQATMLPCASVGGIPTQKDKMYLKIVLFNP